MKPNKKNETHAADSTDKNDLPGYPHYDPSDDIMNPELHIKKLQLLEESGKPIIEKSAEDRSEADITEEDLQILNSDGGDDDELSTRTTPVDFAGKDLDVPENEEDFTHLGTGDEDEANNIYSIDDNNADE